MRTRPSQSNEHGPALEALREELRAKALIERPEVSNLLQSAYNCWNPAIFASLRTRLQLILDQYDTNAQRQPDAFRPYGPETYLKQGSLHLMDQMDQVPFLIDPDKLVTGLLIIGPQGSGKSRLIRHLITELMRIYA